MDAIRIVGGRPLKGEVLIGGAKNAALPEMAAALLTQEPVQLHNIPDVHDVRTMIQLLEYLGVRIAREEDTIVIDASPLHLHKAPYELVKQMRASILVLGPLLARCSEAEVSLPGGCAIGERPIDQHIKGLEHIGHEIALRHGYIHARKTQSLGGEWVFEMPTVTGTENLLMAAVLGEGETILRNCATEPEVTDLAELLQKMGARIEGAGTDTISIVATKQLGGATHTVTSDRIEAGTYLIAAVLSEGEIRVRRCNPHHLATLIEKLRQTHVVVEEGKDELWIRRTGAIEARDITTRVYPGFPTDMQAQYAALMTQAEGTSIIRETIFESRFMHMAELKRMGADITIDGDIAIVRGPTPLSGAKVMATDLRASASLLLAALVAEGETLIQRIYHLDRGYERIEEKLRGLGAVIDRVRQA